jgi:EcsC protein family/Heavy metal associated domain 2
MSGIAHVIHKIPGRIRLRLDQSEGNLNDEDLQRRVQSLSGVNAVQVNPIARSMTIQYDPDSTFEADFSTELATALQSVTFEMNTKPISGEEYISLNYKVIQLTPYEQTQFEAIKLWKHRRISKVKELIGHLLMAGRGLLNVVFLNQALETVASVCERGSASWQRDWEHLKSSAGVEDAMALRRGSLEGCDRLSEHVIVSAIAKASAQGGVSGLFDMFGEIADEGLTLVLALQTIHHIGLCYGYQPQTSDEQSFGWAIFNAAIALTQAEYETIQTTMQSIQRSLNKQALEDETLKDTIEEDLKERLVDSAIEQGIAQLSEETLGGVVPVLSILMNIVADQELIEQVSTAAKREFQLRWLLENQKVRFL